MDSLENMKAKPTVANLSASGAGQPIFMHSNPNHLYQMLYGGISQGTIRKQHEAQSSMFDRIEQLAAAKGGALPGADKQRYGQYVQGFGDINGLRERLARCPVICVGLRQRWTTPTRTRNLKPTGMIACWILASRRSSRASPACSPSVLVAVRFLALGRSRRGAARP